MTKIVLEDNIDLEGYTLIEGFPGVGLVGTLAAGYMIEKRNMEKVGYIDSEKIQPLILIHKGKAQFPIRIYKDPEKKIAVLLSELIIPSKVVGEVSEELIKFVKKQKIKKVISLGGIAKSYQGKKEKMPEVQAIISQKEMEKELEKEDIPLVPEGLIVGLSGILLAKATEENIPAMIMLAQSRKNLPDLEASAKIIDKLNNMVGTNIDTKDLEKEAEEMEKRVKKMIGQIKKVQKHYQEGEEETTPTMYG